MKLKNKDLNIVHYYKKYKNGFTLEIFPFNNHTHSTMSMYVRFGGRDLEFKKRNLKSGTAHFFEHIAFDDREGVTYSDKFAKLNANVNAYTDYERTVYTVNNFIPNTDSYKLLLEMVGKNKVNNKSIEKERSVILEEHDMRKDNPIIPFREKLNEMTFNTYNYNKSIIGNKEDIKNISFDDLNFVADNLYHPSNMYSLVYGLIDDVKEIEKMYDEFNSSFSKKRKIKPKRQREKYEVVNKYYEECRDINNNYLAINYKFKRPFRFSKFKRRETKELIEKILFKDGNALEQKLIDLGLIKSFFVGSIDARKNYETLMILTDGSNTGKIVEVVDDFFTKEIYNIFTKETIKLEQRRRLGTLIMESDQEVKNMILSLDLINYKMSFKKYNKKLKKIDHKKALKYLKKIDVNNKVVLLYKATN